jgi:YhcH/YjgK/YiaL family protein
MERIGKTIPSAATQAHKSMVFEALTQADRYCTLHPLFARAFEFLRSADLLALAPGKHAVQGEELFAIVEHCAGRTREEAKLESHRRYIDIQLVLEGVDEMGWKPLAECTQPMGDFDAARDIRFYGDAPSSWVATPAGSFCIFFPEDAHAPLVSDSMIRKVVMKIAA